MKLTIGAILLWIFWYCLVPLLIAAVVLFVLMKYLATFAPAKNSTAAPGSPNGSSSREMPAGRC